MTSEESSVYVTELYGIHELLLYRGLNITLDSRSDCKWTLGLLDYIIQWGRRYSGRQLDRVLMAPTTGRKRIGFSLNQIPQRSYLVLVGNCLGFYGFIVAFCSGDKMEVLV